MTHTEESLMNLASEYRLAPMREIDATRQARQALRLAIREVLDERDMHKDEAEAQRILRNQQRERAEKAEAECDRLSKDAKRYRWLRARAYKDGATICCHGPDGCYDKYAIGDLCEALDAAIDAALKDQP